MFKKILLVAVICGLLGGSTYAFYRWQKYQKEEAPPAVDISQVIQQNAGKNSSQAITNSSAQSQVENNPITQNQASGDATQNPNNATDSTIADTELPENLNLKMDFYPQAPFGDWDYPWQEACEEASVLLVANTYYQHQWTREQFNEEILKLVEWEKQHFGAYEHTTVTETAEILNQYLNLRTKIHENPTYEEIQQVLAKGHLIVMTFAGKKIGNPFYSNGGPVYHAMVIKGYDKGEKLITQDVGTKRGENYVYSWKKLQNALHDYAEPIENGPQRMIEVFPPENL